MPVISVVVLSYNRADHLRNCLESLSKQRQIADYEVIVSDAGSKEDNIEVAKSFAGRLPLLKIVSHEHKFDENGKDIYQLSLTANTGLMYAEGRIIQFLQHDHIIQPLFLMHLLNVFELTPDTLAPKGICVTGLCSYVGETVEPRDVEALWKLDTWWPGYPRWTRFMGWGQKALTAPERWDQIPLIRTPDWRGVDGFDCAIRTEHCLTFDENFEGQGHEHMDWVYRLAMGGIKFVISPLLRLYHQNHTEARNAEQWEQEIAKSTAYFSKKHGPEAWGHNFG